METKSRHPKKSKKSNFIYTLNLIYSYLGFKKIQKAKNTKSTNNFNSKTSAFKTLTINTTVFSTS